MKNFRKALSLALIIIGIFLLASPVVLARFATVIYAEKFWYSFYPDGTVDDPTMLTPGETIQLKCELVYRDVYAGIDLPGIHYWIVEVTINPGGQTIKLDYQESIYHSEGRYTTAIFVSSWTVPSGECVSYTFSWKVTLRDNNRNVYDTKSTTTYARTIAEEPDGYFTINNKRADQQTTIIVLDPTLSLGFTATKNGEKITIVYVEVWKGGSKIGTVTLSGSNPTWTGTYALPDYGTYQLKGFYTWTGSAQPLQKMSITVGWGEQPPTITLTPLQILGIVCIALGAVLYLTREE